MLLLLLLLAAAATPIPVQFEFEIGEYRYHGSIWVLELEEDPMISEYSLSSVHGVYTGLSHSTVQQMGSATLACSSASYMSILQRHAPVVTGRVLIEGQRTHSFAERTGSVPLARRYALEAFVPLPPVQHPLVAAYMLLSGAEYDVSILSDQYTHRFTGMKIERVDSLKTGDTAHYVDTQYNASSCYPILVYNTTTTPAAVFASNMTCTLGTLQEEGTRLSTYIERVDTGTLTTTVLRQRLAMAAALVYQNTYHACRYLLDYDMSLPNTSTELISDSERCYEPYGSNTWLSDPCCNRELRYHQCCASRTRMVTLPRAQFVPFPECKSPNRAERSFDTYTRVKADARICDGQAQASGGTFSDAASLTRLIPICYAELFGDDQGLATCLSDENCYTRCDTKSGRCIPPYDNPEPPLWQCIEDNAHPLLLRIWKQQQQDQPDLNLTEACTGPTASEFNGHCDIVRVTECPEEGGTECYCVPYTSERVARDSVKRTLDVRQRLRALLQRNDNPWDHSRYEQGLAALQSTARASGVQHECYRIVHVDADKSACLSDMRCNWDQTKSLSECSGGALTTRFCGECQSGPCWDVSSQPMCYTRVDSPQECSAMGGAIGPWGLWHCVFGTLTAEEDCLPLRVCAPRPGLEENRELALGDRYCGSSCTLRDQDSTFNCSAVGGWWNSQTARCTLPLDREACLELDAEFAEWFPGRTFRPGVLHTQSLCEKGRCSTDARLSVEECETTAACTKTCSQCVPMIPGTTICHTSAVDETACTGIYDQKYQACVFTHLHTEDECMAASNGNYTFESCQNACTTAVTSTLSPLAASRLLCYLNRWQTCNTQQECEASGDCSDWELQNWYDRQYCWNADTATAKVSSDCTGVCVFPYAGVARCQFPRVYTKMGCVDYALTQRAVCSSSGGTWQTRAFTSLQCMAHGQNCEELSFIQPTAKSDSQCSACAQSTSRNRYEWSAGEWRTGHVDDDVRWVLREFTSINRWQPTIDWKKLHAHIEHLSLQAIVDPLKSALMCKFNMETVSLQQIVCDCISDAGTDCFKDTSSALGQQRFYTGVRKRALWGHVQVEVSHTMQEYVLITAQSLNSANLLTYRENRGRSPYNPNQYEVVTNHVDYVVGQLISNGVSMVIPPNTTINVCIDVDQSIPRDPESIYPTVDFAGYNASIPKWWPLSLYPVTVVGNYSQVCADINSTGTYFAILRLDNWPYATGTLATTTTTAPATTAATTITTTTSTTTSGNTTSTTTPAVTLVTVESTLSGGTIVVIILASIAGVALLAVVIACCATHTTTRKPIGRRVRSVQRITKKYK